MMQPCWKGPEFAGLAGPEGYLQQTARFSATGSRKRLLFMFSGIESKTDFHHSSLLPYASQLAMDQSDVDHLLSQSPKPATILAVSAIVFVTVKLASAYLRLRHIPGPFLAALTNFVRRSWVLAGDLHQKHTDLHRQYGTVVRVGPNAVLVSQPEAIDSIYGFKARFLKVIHIIRDWAQLTNLV